jgi:sugar O-acyltransferase (sialic acid O-acetyltransferase NeuD family)
VNKPIIILGAGGHAKVLIDTLKLRSIEILGLLDSDLSKNNKDLMGISVIGSDQDITTFPASTYSLVNGIGSVKVDGKRKKIFEYYKLSGYFFERVIHPSAIISSNAVLLEGAQVLAGVIIQCGTQIGINSIINTGAIIDHDCCIGDHVHISPGVVLSGGVIVGSNTHIGTGATVIQGIKIGCNSMIAAGAVVVKDVEDNVTVRGVPAREFSKK